MRRHWYLLIAAVALILFAVVSPLIPSGGRRQPTSSFTTTATLKPRLNATLKYVFFKPIRTGNTTLLSYLIVVEVHSANSTVKLSGATINIPEEMNGNLVLRTPMGSRELAISLKQSTLKSPGEGVIKTLVAPSTVEKLRGIGAANDLLLERGAKSYPASPVLGDCVVSPKWPILIVFSGTLPLPKIWAQRLAARLSSPLIISLHLEGESLNGVAVNTMGIYLVGLKHENSAYIAGTLPPGLGENLSNTC